MPLPLPPDQAPLVLLDLLYKLKIRDVMTPSPITVARQDTLRHAQTLMRENRVTGLPVAENSRLYGIVSMDDILRALESGWMDDPVERHMARNVVVLEEDMPLAFGASYFEKYRFGRFPVLDRNRRLVGILTSRDVSAAVLVELLQEFTRLEARLPPADAAPPHARQTTLQFALSPLDFERAGRASHEIKRALADLALDPRLIRRVAVAAYEMEMNIILHSKGGRLTAQIAPDRIELEARDTGPGIPDVSRALEEGFTTASDWIKSLGFGAGMGLPNIRRVSDEFSIQSSPEGTMVRSLVFVPPSPPSTSPAP